MQLIISIVLSIALMIWVFIAHQRKRDPVSTAAISVVLGGLCAAPAVFLHAVLVVIGAVLWKYRGWGTRSLAAYMLSAMIVTYGFLGCVALKQIADHHGSAF